MPVTIHLPDMQKRKETKMAVPRDLMDGHMLNDMVARELVYRDNALCFELPIEGINWISNEGLTPSKDPLVRLIVGFDGFGYERMPMLKTNLDHCRFCVNVANNAMKDYFFSKFPSVHTDFLRAVTQMDIDARSNGYFDPKVYNTIVIAINVNKDLVYRAALPKEFEGLDFGFYAKTQVVYRGRTMPRMSPDGIDTIIKTQDEMTNEATMMLTYNGQLQYASYDISTAKHYTW